MIKLLTVIGARPQIIKAAALSRAISSGFSDKLSEIIVHTGQHYDENMSQVFFSELGIPAPDHNLGVGSSTHGAQTAEMIKGLEEIMLNEQPDAIVVYGDTNSTLAGAIAASKLLIPIVHIEAGLRSFNKHMPEEINRIMCDHASTLLFSPTNAGLKNLINEGFDPEAQAPYSMNNPSIYHCGDVMYDNSKYFGELAESQSTILTDHGLEENNFILATIHRDNNTDDPERLSALFNALNEISVNHKTKVILPLHPRTSKLLDANVDSGVLNNVKENELFILREPVSFIEMTLLEKNSQLVITDSGGVQKEAYFFKKPCIVLRPETEWTELVESGTTMLCDADMTKILRAYEELSNKELDYPPLFGDGKASEFICDEIIKNVGAS